MKFKLKYLGMPSPEIVKFHNSCPVIDLHNDALLTWKIFRVDLRRQHPSPSIIPKGYLLFHTDVPRLHLGNVSAVFLGLVPKPFGRNAAHIESMINQAEKISHQIPQLCTMARSAEDIERAKKERKIALLLGMEGATCLDGDPRRLQYFAKQGVRYVGLVHFNANFVASPGVGLASKGDNLTAYGKFVVEECVRNNLILDLAHISPRGFFEVLKLLPEKVPAIVSHTGINKAHRHKRNLSDDQVCAIAATGGVIGVMNQSLFLGGHKMQDYINHILAARDLAGYKHVAIGSDFDGMISPMHGFEDVTRFPSLTAALLECGLPQSEVRAILGENMLRVLRTVPPKYPLPL